jgi:cbb3-type cytochrome oxidase subunit 1
MINGLLTLRGAWHKVATDPVLKFFVVGITFYGMSTFEGPMLSIKSVNASATTPTGRSPTCTPVRWAGTGSWRSA